MNTQEIFAYVREQLGPDALQEVVEPIGDPFVYVDRAKLVDVCRLLRDDAKLDFKHLSLVTGLDWPDRYESVYHLVSYTHHHTLTLKTRMPKSEGEPVCPSVMGIWNAADWHEREQYDMFGIRYTGHTNLRRILLAEDWLGFPLRKDYVAPEEYNGISNLP